MHNIRFPKINNAPSIEPSNRVSVCGRFCVTSERIADPSGAKSATSTPAFAKAAPNPETENAGPPYSGKKLVPAKKTFNVSTLVPHKCKLKPKLSSYFIFPRICRWLLIERALPDRHSMAQACLCQRCRSTEPLPRQQQNRDLGLREPLSKRSYLFLLA